MKRTTLEQYESKGVPVSDTPCQSIVEDAFVCAPITVPEQVVLGHKKIHVGDLTVTYPVRGAKKIRKPMSDARAQSRRRIAETWKYQSQDLKESGLLEEVHSIYSARRKVAVDQDTWSHVYCLDAHTQVLQDALEEEATRLLALAGEDACIECLGFWEPATLQEVPDWVVKERELDWRTR